jgi:hypothetical protein
MLPTAAKGHHPGAGSRSCKKHIFFSDIPSNRQQTLINYTEEREGAKLRSMIYSAG